MENRNDFEPSDLIYLFLDGEADGVQQAMLFGMLAANSDMQTEFSEALQLRSAVETERSEGAPPAALTRELFEKAGFAVAPTTTASIASSAAIPSAILGMLRRFGVPLLCAAAGALITALLFSNAYQERYGRMEEEIRRLSTARESASVVASASPGEGARGTTMQKGEDPIANDDGPLRSSTGRAGSRRTNGPATSAMTARSARVANPTAIEGTTRRNTVTATTRTAHDIAAPVIEGSEEQEIASAIRPTIEPTTAISVAPAQRGTIAPNEPPAMRSTSIASEPLSPLDEPRAEEARGFSLQLRGMTDLRFFPSLELSKEAQPWFNNMSVGGLYHISSNQAFGLELGQEYLPMYRSNGETVTKDDHISWATGLYQLQSDPITLLGGVRPFVQGGLGTSESGPVGRGTVGLSYAPEGRVDLAIGAEGTAFFYRLDGTWYSARKAGITYMVRVHF